MNSPLVKFQSLLRELFQFDCADLDFGIYRIMNHKRDVVERFITADLPAAVAAELAGGALAAQSQAVHDLELARKKVLEALGEEALGADGTLDERYQATKAGREYLTAKAKAAGTHGRDALEAVIFNHLYTFFSRYYQDGDFISKRRYSKRERYAIPYNGEEVHLYWANHDQYYIKTGEYFTDYAFTANGVTVQFKLQAADVEQNNVKGEKRFFLPRPADMVWDEAEKRLAIPFEYRPLTKQESIAFGQKNQQEAILADGQEKIRSHTKTQRHKEMLTASGLAVKATTADGKPVTYLEHHLRQYTRRNSSDFFIHKDLKGFLSRELDFYLKNEVLNLDELTAAGEERAEGWFQTLRTIKAVGGRIIEFLHQIEEFQKMLWEKRKFITETGYCITVGVVPAEFYPEIVSCDAQWEEWQALFCVEEAEPGLTQRHQDTKRIAFLKTHPTLVLDTRHYDQGFVDRLLGSFDDLDDVTDGLLVHSENWQGLSLLQERYHASITEIFADPPYNTGVDGFIYKDVYQHSSWLALLYDRLAHVRNLMSSTALLFLTIDFVEVSRLRLLCDIIFGSDNFLADIAWEKRYTRSNNAKLFYSLKDTVLCYRSSDAVSFLRESRTEKSLSNYSNPDNDSRGDWISSSYVNPATKEQRKNLSYPIYHPYRKNNIEHPTHAWKYDRRTYDQHVKDDRLYWGIDGTYDYPRLKSFLSEASDGMVPIDLWHYKIAGTSDDGGNVVKSMFESAVFDNPKPPSLIQKALSLSLQSSSSGIILDHFAGSGTTGHAVINMNRADGGRRKFILVEMADYFDTVIIPRIKKVTYSSEWKNGKPKRMAMPEEAERSPRIVKYIRLESYEDALNNISFDEASGQQAMRFDDYLLQYLLSWETRASETLLNVEKLTRPFAYKLSIHTDGQTRERLVDIPETFAYLLGLHVRTRRTFDNSGRRYLVYRGSIDHREVAVIWRDTEGWRKADYERDRDFVAGQKLAVGVDELFINGDSLIPAARALEPIFKARLFAPVE